MRCFTFQLESEMFYVSTCNFKKIFFGMKKVTK